ncbi:MAG: 23S rRNA (adenine(2503)-C(2))-methyltransferase RlmN [Deltaproteobacteria bacterium]|nr:23S rRNA (adenine(2503)-C(2))-methyltransferase RlmN [Deltaproteobacteria bacterium]
MLHRDHAGDHAGTLDPPAPDPLADKEGSEAETLEARPDLRSLRMESLESIVEELGERPFRAKQISRWLHQKGVRSFGQMSDLSLAFRTSLEERARIGSMSVRRREVARDGTRKYAFATDTGHVVESVYIPDASTEGRNTLCISSQVGCAIDCKFCLTASLGLIRNLSAGEIVEQLTRVKEDLAADFGASAPGVHNVVMMGMGEPLQNYVQLVRALAILQDDAGHKLSSRRITVSTSGLAPRIPRLGRDTKVNLAVSLNATTDEVRSRIMPINKRYDIASLLAACREFPLPERRRITFEYVLLAGVNDSDEDARRLVGLLRGLRAKVNLIPFNEHPYSPFKRPLDAKVARFQDLVASRGLSVFVRTPRGDDISAACGQLGVEVQSPKRLAVLSA